MIQTYVTKRHTKKTNSSEKKLHEKANGRRLAEIIFPAVQLDFIFFCGRFWPLFVCEASQRHSLISGEIVGCQKHLQLLAIAASKSISIQEPAAKTFAYFYFVWPIRARQAGHAQRSFRGQATHKFDICVMDLK